MTGCKTSLVIRRLAWLEFYALSLSYQSYSNPLLYFDKKYVPVPLLPILGFVDTGCFHSSFVSVVPKQTKCSTPSDWSRSTGRTNAAKSESTRVDNPKARSYGPFKTPRAQFAEGT